MFGRIDAKFVVTTIGHCPSSVYPHVHIMHVTNLTGLPLSFCTMQVIKN